MNRLRIAHCSDTHLDSSGHRVGSTDLARDGMAAVLAAICAHHPDVLLFSGDLFDHNRARAETIAWAQAQLAGLPFPVLMIPGNHDCMEPNGVFHRYDFNTLPNVQNLTAADGELAHLPSLSLAAWGKGMVDHSLANRPLAGIPPRPAGVRWYVGMAHGMFVPEGETTDRSSPMHEQDIVNSPFDYLALGHHHAAKAIPTARGIAAFAGSPTDRIGVGASYIIVDLAEGEPPALQILVLG